MKSELVSFLIIALFAMALVQWVLIRFLLSGRVMRGTIAPWVAKVMIVVTVLIGGLAVVGKFMQDDGSVKPQQVVAKAQVKPASDGCFEIGRVFRWHDLGLTVNRDNSVTIENLQRTARSSVISVTRLQSWELGGQKLRGEITLNPNDSQTIPLDHPADRRLFLNYRGDYRKIDLGSLCP
ncbi:MAG: hypothetical protein V1763_01740 [Parcubacteria group bacterium]